MLFFPTPIPKTSELGQSSPSFYFKVPHVMVPTNSSDLQSSSIFFYSFTPFTADHEHSCTGQRLSILPDFIHILELPSSQNYQVIALHIPKNLFIQELTQMLTPCKAFSESTSHQYFLFLNVDIVVTCFHTQFFPFSIIQSFRHIAITVNDSPFFIPVFSIPKPSKFCTPAIYQLKQLMLES